jgi:hypothetical protein
VQQREEHLVGGGGRRPGFAAQGRGNALIHI